MDVTPAPRAQRLERAGCLAARAARLGARLVVLPEVFNTGYAYTLANFSLAETIAGPTVQWMKETAASCGIHLAGSLLLLENRQVYNAMLLVAPDGRLWRYDKNYPWGWERGYFRPSRSITVAYTNLGDLGMMVCWDAGHPGLWRRYSGQVDLMVICSSPPDYGNPVFLFPGGGWVSLSQMGPLMGRLKGVGRLAFGSLLDQQAAWLGVPAVCTVACGQFRSGLDNGIAGLVSLLPSAPWLVKYLREAREMQVSCEMVAACKVIGSDGKILASQTQADGESFAIAEVALPDSKPQPAAPLPPSPLPWMAYFVADRMLPWLSLPVYRRGIRSLQETIT